MPIDQAEALLACTGLRQVLDGKPPFKKEIDRSIDLEAELEDAVVSYLHGKKHPPAAAPSDIEIPDQLPDTAHGAVSNLNGDAAVSYGLAAARALDYLNQLVPRRPLPGLTAKLADYTAAEKAGRRRAWQVIEDPVAVLGDLDGLAADQLDAMRTVYPTMFAALGLATSSAMAKVDRDLTGRQERVLGRVLGVSVGDVAALQLLHQQGDRKDGAPPPQGASGSGDSTDLASPIQRLAAKA